MQPLHDTAGRVSDSDRIGEWKFQILINKSQIGTAGTVVIGPSQPRVDAVEAYANGQLAALSPGALAIIRGANLARSADSAPGVPLPMSLGGAGVTINDVQAPIFHTETDALYVQVPAGIRADSGMVRVTTDQGVSNPYRMPLLTVSPALVPDDADASQAQAFRWGGDGSFARVSADAPLQRGDTAVLVASGLGATLNPPRDGDRGADGSLCVFASDVAIGRVAAPVTGCMLGGLSRPVLGLRDRSGRSAERRGSGATAREWGCSRSAQPSDRGRRAHISGVSR